MPAQHSSHRTSETAVEIVLPEAALKGDLAIPADVCGTVIFAHGSGSSRLSSRNRYVASVLQDAGIATLLFDLLTREEEIEEQYTRHLRFDIDMLARRLVGVTEWLKSQKRLENLKTGYFGASTGGGAAIVATAKGRDHISAIVSRGGRPDLAGGALSQINTPTLLIVGGNDDVVINLNQEALARMKPGVAQLDIVEGATHLFEEPGTLERAAALAREWFVKHLCNDNSPSSPEGKA